MVMTYKEVDDYCRRHRESDGFCSICSSCSGPSYSNLACDFPHDESVDILRGGRYGSCYFEVAAENSAQD